MNNIHTLPTGHILVQLPEGAENLQIMKGILNYNLIGHTFVHHLRLPENNTYTLLGIASALSEDDSKRVVEKKELLNAEKYMIERYRDYKIYIENYACSTAKQSLQSLILHYGYDPEGCVVVGIS